MMNTKVVLTGHILEETSELSLTELCESCRVPTESMIELVEHGIISPSQGETTRQWRFQSASIVRADKALTLKQDLKVNVAGTALILELLDEINELKVLLYRDSA